MRDFVADILARLQATNRQQRLYILVGVLAAIVVLRYGTTWFFDYRDGVKYMVLRNPWGSTESSVGTLPGTTRFYDVSWWRSIDMVAVDGVFGVDAETFRTYFNYIGGCKE